MESNDLFDKAEQTLLDALELAEWQPPEPLTYTCSSQTVLAAGRFDSQYFAPRVAQLLLRLGGDGRTIRDVAPPRTVKFKRGKSSTFRYMDLHTSASLYPAISADDLLSLPIPNIPPQVSETIIDLVRSAHALRRNSQTLLERAKRAVELAIEEGEAAGLSFIENNI